MSIKAELVNFLVSGIEDLSGDPLALGKVYTYAAGTTTPLSLYEDFEKLYPSTNPVILSSTGNKVCYGDGNYKFEITKADGTPLIIIDNIALFYADVATTVATSISAGTSAGLSLKDDGGNLGVLIKDGGNVGIKGDFNPLSALGIADSSSLAYSSTIGITTITEDIIRERNTSNTGYFSSIRLEANGVTPSVARLICKRAAADTAEFYIQLNNGVTPTVTTESLKLDSYGNMTLPGKLITNKFTIDTNTISVSSGNINVTPFTGSAVLLDGHNSFDANIQTGLTDNNTLINAYAGKAVVIEETSIDNKVISSVTSLSGESSGGLAIFSTAGTVVAAGTLVLSLPGNYFVGTLYIIDRKAGSGGDHTKLYSGFVCYNEALTAAEIGADNGSGGARIFGITAAGNSITYTSTNADSSYVTMALIGISEKV